MENLKSLIEQLRASGFTPRVDLSVPANTTDIEAVKAIQSKLKAAGIPAEIHIQISLSDAVGSETEPLPDTTLESNFAVVVQDDKLNFFIFKKRDGAGKPIFEIREPRIQLFRGERFLVSAEHRESDKDPGDGTIIGTGGTRFYFVVDCPSKPEAVGMYVREAEVARV